MFIPQIYKEFIMNAKKLLLGLGSVVLLSSIAFAQPMQGCDSRKCPNMQKKQMQNSGCKMKNKNGMKNNMKYPKGHKKGHGGHIIGAIMHLDLSDAQRLQIKKIMQKNKQNRVKISDAFSETGFDKALFIKLSEQRKANKIQNRADIIEAVYNVLTPEQKKELKQNMNKKMFKPQRG